MSAAAPKRDLVSDNKGAVMLTGLFMSCFLCGALWFIMGIGDAINFRDQMQEAADHGAFTAAAFDAKGMNFIALCNLLMIVGTIIHIVLGIITDIAGAIYSACLAGCFVLVGCTCVIPAYRAWTGLFKAWDIYFTGMKFGFKALWKGEQIASYAYPAAGSVNAFEVGYTYNYDAKRTEMPIVVALTASMLPTGPLQSFADKVGNKIFKPETPKSGVTKEGFLPVEPRKREELCIKVVSVVSTNVLIGMGNASYQSPTGKAASIFNGLIGGGLKWRYCNDKSKGTLPFLARSPAVYMPWPSSGYGPSPPRVAPSCNGCCGCPTIAGPSGTRRSPASPCSSPSCPTRNAARSPPRSRRCPWAPRGSWRAPPPAPSS